MTKIYFANCIRRKEKYIDYKDLLPKCINDSNYFNSINKYSINLLF